MLGYLFIVSGLLVACWLIGTIAILVLRDWRLFREKPSDLEPLVCNCGSQNLKWDLKRASRENAVNGKVNPENIDFLFVLYCSDCGTWADYLNQDNVLKFLNTNVDKFQLGKWVIES